MNLLITMAKDLGRPSSMLSILFVVGVGVLLLYGRRTAVWGRRWLTAVFLVYWAMSTPAGARLISAPIAGRHRPIETVAEAQGAQAVVMLGGGISSHVADGGAIDDFGKSSFRVIETARVYRLLGDPLVILSGGNTQKLNPPRTEAAAYRDAAVQLGIPAGRIVLDERSLTTREQALTLKVVLAGHGITRFVLVTSPPHMSRALSAFRAVGLDPVGSVSAIRNARGYAYWSPIPERESLAISDMAIYDYAAALYYWSRGWQR